MSRHYWTPLRVGTLVVIVVGVSLLVLKLRAERHTAQENRVEANPSPPAAPRATPLPPSDLDRMRQQIAQDRIERESFRAASPAVRLAMVDSGQYPQPPRAAVEKMYERLNKLTALFGGIEEERAVDSLLREHESLKQEMGDSLGNYLDACITIAEALKPCDGLKEFAKVRELYPLYRRGDGGPPRPRKEAIEATIAEIRDDRRANGKTP